MHHEVVQPRGDRGPRAALIVAAPLLAEQAGRDVEPAGGFSYLPPAGWTLMDFPGLKYKVAIGPVTDGFAANINVVDESYHGNLSDYVAANSKNMKAVFKNMKVESQDNFQSDSGEHGCVMICSDEQQGKSLRQTFMGTGNMS
jgi:hypothetical protein